MDRIHHRLNSISKSSQSYVFLFGNPVHHSLSPAMHNAAFKALGLPWKYLSILLKPEQIALGVELLKLPQVRGANITVPYKEAVGRYLNQLSPWSHRLQSVNTCFKNPRGALYGTTTDGEGFLKSLGSYRKKISQLQVLILGAGGSARAVASALVLEGAKRVHITNRTTAKAVELKRKLQTYSKTCEIACLDIPEAEKQLHRYDMIVQATSLGLNKNDPSPIRLTKAQPGSLAVDLIYHHRTEFLRLAQMNHLKTLDGLLMLLYQGMLSFEYWTRQKAPKPIMYQALLKSRHRFNKV